MGIEYIYTNTGMCYSYTNTVTKPIIKYSYRNKCMAAAIVATVAVVTNITVRQAVKITVSI